MHPTMTVERGALKSWLVSSLSKSFYLSFIILSSRGVYNHDFIVVRESILAGLIFFIRPILVQKEKKKTK